jgi:ATP adenylyltransferase
MSETLWAPWRMEYILEDKPDGCIFCNAVQEGERGLEKNRVVYIAEHTYVIMNRFPYTYAHLMVVPNKHADRLEKLSEKERRELGELWLQAQRVVMEALSPQGINLGMNIGQAAGAGIEAHLHAHVVPRWIGDTNFMPMLADARVMPEHLDETYRKLKRAFERRM